MYKLCFHVPPSHLEVTKSAVFEAGAGAWGQYDHCCFELHGQGQFRPKPGSDPFVGDVGVLETVDEVRVEMVCVDTCLSAAVAALKDAHPYEVPAIYVWRVEEV